MKEIVDCFCYLGIILSLIGIYKCIIEIAKINRKIKYIDSDQLNIKEMRKLKLKELNRWKFPKL